MSDRDPFPTEPDPHLANWVGDYGERVDPPESWIREHPEMRIGQAVSQPWYRCESFNPADGLTYVCARFGWRDLRNRRNRIRWWWLGRRGY